MRMIINTVSWGLFILCISSNTGMKTTSKKSAQIGEKKQQTKVAYKPIKKSFNIN